jgi:hypothetical protein
LGLAGASPKPPGFFAAIFLTPFNSFHFLDWLFRKQISERRDGMPRPVPCGFAEKKSSLPAKRARYFFSQSLVLQPAVFR